MKILLIILLFASCTSHFITKKDRIIIKGDEIPGIGGTINKPDTCVAYYDKKNKAIYIRYLRENPAPLIRY